MIPLGDDNAATGLPVVTYTLMTACVAVFAWQLSWPAAAGNAPLAGLGFVPGLLFGGAEPVPGVPALPPPATLVSYAFLHGGWLHLIGNLGYFWVFGRSLERALGAGTTCTLFVATAVAAALAQAAADPASAVAVIGASGGVSGLLGAYLVRFPRAEVEVLVPIIIVMQVVKLPAWVLLAAWFGLQLALDALTPAGAAGIAFRAHVGGFVAGALAMLALRGVDPSHRMGAGAAAAAARPAGAP